MMTQTAPPGHRLLFLLPFPPRLDAAHGGGKVIAQLINRLATRHQVALIYLRGADEPPLDDALRAKCAWVEEVVRPWTRLTLSDQLIRNIRLVVSLLGRMRPMWVTDWHSSQFEQRVQKAIAQWQPEVVQADFHIMGQYFAQVRRCESSLRTGHERAGVNARAQQRSPVGFFNSTVNGRAAARIPCVLVEYEPGLRAAPYLKKSLPLLIRSALHRLDRKAWQKYEQAIIRQAQTVVVFTASDKKALAPFLQRTPARVIPIGIDIPQHSANPAGSDPPSLVFVGNFLHPPNIDAAQWLMQDIFPRLQNEFPSLKLVIVGDHPTPALKRFANDYINLTGHVPDVAPYLNDAAVFVAPMQTGGGMRVKVLEALAAGKAVVATPLAAEGLAVTDGDQIALAQTSAEFAQRIAALLRDPVARAAMASRARAWAEVHLGWPASVAAYEAVYDGILAETGLSP